MINCGRLVNLRGMGDDLNEIYWPKGLGRSSNYVGKLQIFTK